MPKELRCPRTDLPILLCECHTFSPVDSGIELTPEQIADCRVIAERRNRNSPVKARL